MIRLIRHFVRGLKQCVRDNQSLLVVLILIVLVSVYIGAMLEHYGAIPWEW